jgi:hypothetical protein
MTNLRIAILVGINDYEGKPLTYCVKDVEALDANLQSKCKFNKIFAITSSSENSRNGIYHEFLKILETIKTEYPNEQLDLLFYFSGHGIFKKETFLEFHDDPIPMQEIFDRINTLNPSHQVYILDACHAGFGVEVKGSADTAAIMELYNQRYISKSDGVYFLCSCKENETAKAYPKYQNGVFTHYLIEGLNNTKIYDRDLASLSLPVLHEYVSKKISLNYDYQQTPFMQVHSSGYYPFAFLDAPASQKLVNLQLPLSKDENEIIDFILSDAINAPRTFKKDLAHLFAELIFNLFEHNFSSGVALEVKGHVFRLLDYSKVHVNPFKALHKEGHSGVIVRNRFFETYEDRFEASYTPGNPNVIEFHFDESLFLPKMDHCSFYIEERNFWNPRVISNLEFDPACEEILIDLSHTILPLCRGGHVFDYLIQMTSKTKPLIMIRLDKDDNMLRKDLQNVLDQSEEYKRIMVI